MVKRHILNIIIRISVKTKLCFTRVDQKIVFMWSSFGKI